MITQLLQAKYGGNSNLLDDAIKFGFLPESFRNYRQQYLSTWDIETLETKPELHAESALQIDALHTVASIR